MHKNILEFEYANDLIVYDPQDGSFKWRKTTCSRAIAGKKAGYTRTNSGSGKSYHVIGLNNNKYFGGNVAWLLYYKKWPSGIVDHLDGNGLNNRINNLQEKTIAENRKNVRLCCKNKTGISGVHFSVKSNIYRAQIGNNRKKINLINSKDFFEACCARKSAENKYGFHENHGSIRPL